MKKLFISILMCVILLFSSNAMALQEIVVETEEFGSIHMICDENIHQVPENEFTFLGILQDWERVDPYCIKDDCRFYRLWIIGGKSKCLEMYKEEKIKINVGEMDSIGITNY